MMTILEEKKNVQGESHVGKQLKPQSGKILQRRHILRVRRECRSHEHKQSHAKIIGAFGATRFEFGVDDRKHNFTADKKQDASD
jgi:hypothetical protein